MGNVKKATWEVLNLARHHKLDNLVVILIWMVFKALDLQIKF